MMKIFFLTSLKLCLVATKFNISNIQKVTLDDDHTDMSETKLKSYHQFVTCYNNEQLSEVLGNKFKTTDYIPDLKTISFDNMISSCNVTGVWLFYDRVNYSGSTTFWAIGYNFSVKIPEFFNNKAISLRFVGAPDDWKASSLNLYSDVNFTREEEFAYGDIPEIKIKAKSVIVTGCEPWTVYQESIVTNREFRMNKNSICSENMNIICGQGSYSNKHLTRRGIFGVNLLFKY